MGLKEDSDVYMEGTTTLRFENEDEDILLIVITTNGPAV